MYHQGPRSTPGGRQQVPAVVPVIPADAVQPACSYASHACSRPRVEGYAFCLRHILEDRAAPYKQCSYVYATNGRRCLNPTPKTDKKESGFCSDHARRAQLARQKSARRRAPPFSTESLLLGLNHYSSRNETTNSSIVDNSNNATSSVDAELTEGNESTSDQVTRALNPFVEIDASKVNNEASRVLDYASESDSDLEVATFDSTWPGPEVDSSDADSMDGSLEESCKWDRFSSFQHAGVYTAEEAAQLTKDKLIRLQSLYIDQFRRLQQALRLRKRRYLITLKREKETLCSVHSQQKESGKELKLYRKLCALNRYQRRCGVEAILHKKNLERRAMATEGVNIRPPPTTKCTFTEGGVKCGERTIPVAKYCLKHILQDAHQVLFRPCGSTKAGFSCQEPVPSIFENSSCIYHTSLPPPPPHLSASHILAEEVAAAKLKMDLAETAMISEPTPENMSGNEVPKMNQNTDITPSISPSRPPHGMEGDPSESFQSETSTTDTASFEETLNNIEANEEC